MINYTKRKVAGSRSTSEIATGGAQGLGPGQMTRPGKGHK